MVDTFHDLKGDIVRIEARMARVDDLLINPKLTDKERRRLTKEYNELKETHGKILSATPA
jgi:hypothetical protein